MQWLQLIVGSTRDASSAIEDALLELGAVSVTLEDAADQPILEPGVGETPLWDNCIIKALFADDTDTNATIVYHNLEGGFWSIVTNDTCPSINIPTFPSRVEFVHQEGANCFRKVSDGFMKVSGRCQWFLKEKKYSAAMISE